MVQREEPGALPRDDLEDVVVLPDQLHRLSRLANGDDAKQPILDWQWDDETRAM